MICYAREIEHIIIVNDHELTKKEVKGNITFDKIIEALQNNN